MAKKYEIITELYLRTVAAITTPRVWQSFLCTACRNFRLPFDEQALLFAQRPEATAVLPIEGANGWNQRFGRWVNRGATGIAVLDGESNGRGRLKYYFDISDTHESRFSRPVPLWVMRPTFEPAVIETLENSFGALEDKSNLAAALLSTAKNAVEDNMPDYLAELKYNTKDSFLEELDDLNLEVEYRRALQNSVGYMLLTRCGVDASRYFEEDDFRDVTDFNTLQTLNALGVATGDIGQMCLGEISRTVLSLQRQTKEQNRTFANRSGNQYPIHRTETAQTERSIEYGENHVHDAKRLQTAQSPAAPGAGDSTWEIRITAPQLPEAEPPGDLHESVDQREAETAPDRDSAGSVFPDRTRDSADGGEAGRDGGTESVQSDEVGGLDEQHSSVGGGSGAGGVGVHLSASLPTEEEQKEAIQAAEDETSSAFTISQEDIDYVLCGGSGISQGKYRIFEQFQKNEGKQKNIKFLKEHYGIGGRSDAIPGSGYWEEYNGKGITISRSYRDPDGKLLLTWAKVEKRIGELIAADRYLNRVEKEYYPVYQAQVEERKARWVIVKEIRSIIDDYVDFKTQLGEKEQCSEILFAKRCADSFGVGDKKCYVLTMEGSFVLPALLNAMQTIIGDNTHLTERCEAMLAELNGPLAAPLEPTYDELNPPPPPKKEYRFSLGDTVYLGAQEYEMLAFDEQTVRLFDPAFPIISKDLPREEFDRLLAENPLNDSLLQVVEEAPAAETVEPDTPGYDLGFGHLGNGVTVWNRLELRDGDYKTIAHIAPNRTVTYYEGGLPEDVRAQIEEFAATSTMTISATQDAPVFSTPPLVQEPVVPPAEANEPAYPPRELPYIFCEWSENAVFQGKTAYSLSEFDRLMKQTDDAYVTKKAAAMAKYGTWQRWCDADDPEYSAFLSYDKVKFTLVMPDGRTFTERQDIGDGDGGVLDFLSQYDAYREIVPVLREAVRKEVEVAQSGSASQPELASGRFWDAYNSIKEHNPDSLVLYQVGDFFELYGGLEGDDAWSAATALDLTLTERNIPAYGRVSMCGVPAHKLEDYVKELHSKGFDVVVAVLENNRHVTTMFPAKPSEKAEQKADDFSDIDPAAVRAALAENGIVDGHVVDPEKLDSSAFIQQVKADVEQIAANTPPAPERFSIIETDNGYAVWDDIRDGIYVDGEGVQEEFTSEWQAEDYLKQVRKAVADKEAAEWLAVERAKQGTPEPAEKEMQPPPPVSRRKSKVSPFVLHPEVPAADRHEYRITDDTIGAGTPGERFNNNVRAIRLLKKLEQVDRFATPEEQAVLAQYVGWGGLADCFDERHSKYAELKALLTEDEYTAARESTLTAFYTPPVVIRFIYQALENLGFRTGNILEPSCGIGNFIGMRPEALANSKIYGVELDSISGRIAQQLYQKSSIAVQGFEKTDLPDSFFDAAIGNVPFGSFKVSDKRYDKHNFLIHDYFFARTLDKVRPGGIIAFVTSKGTMDKENPAVRKYIAQRADLLGAIRLPNNTFKDAAGTEVTSDILFLQKRDALSSEEPAWVHLNTIGVPAQAQRSGLRGERRSDGMSELSASAGSEGYEVRDDANGLKMNQYFIDHRSMVIGEMLEISGPYGPETACLPRMGQNLGEQLADAIQNIQGSITDYVLDDPEAEGEDKSIPADPNVRNFSYTVVDRQVYYRENSRMNPVEVSVTAANRIKGLIGIRDCVRTLIDYQTEDWPIEDIQAEQKKLNALYDAFVEKYGRINSRANSTAFSMDSAYFLLTSLEVLDDERNFVRKADMFTKRTIKQKVVVTSVDTASEALAVSLAEKAKVDMPFMMELTGKTEQEVYADLTGVIFLNPMHGYGSSAEEKYVTADEYLSGNVREKLEWAKRSAEQYRSDYAANVEALERVQPTDLTASEISVRLGATWLPPEIVEQFMFELFSTPNYCQWNIHVRYFQHTGDWNVEGKSYDKSNIKAHNTYGTERINGYKIIEETLNLRDVRIFDYVQDENGKRTPVLNKKETAIAQGKQELIKQAFQDWIWKDHQRRERLTRLYNDKFNSTRPREYDGSHLNFVGMNPEITLRPHQVNAIAHILYGGNTLLAHVVGAGKTFEMVAAAQESKRLGLCQKSLFVVPNHLTEQWASEYLQLYPSANILVATKKDFETKNRKRFCGRIATGDYDAIIIGHSQFEKIPVSVERQRYLLEQQRREILDGIAELKASHGERFSIKQMERTKKSIDAKLEKLNDQSRKDDVVTFEELGVDRIFVDEAHYYKNLAAFSKMRNVGGISQTEAQKSSDLYMKCRYLDELTGGRGVIFATGTPISNTMVEMYTMQKYLQYGTLEKRGLLNFDAWASTFGETVTAIELAPEGTGYRAKTRFSRFYNLPELMSMFKEVADIQTADMLNLPVPKAEYHNIVLNPSEQQKEMVAALGARAERVRNKMVDSTEDNMLLITNDGRKLALDQRLLNPMLSDSDAGKVSACADNVFQIWQDTADQRSTQMVFCDLSTPKGNGDFNVYDDLRDKLIAKGIPAEEIAYIHTANTEVQKKELFGKVRSGQIRVLLGSTQKMGAGTNVQRKLVALHHCDCPWRPSDLQQREGRIIRQGNENDEVDIYTYVTENTFDSYLYQLVEGKQKFIGQIMTSKSPVRSVEDIDETALSYAEIKALCTGNPYIKEKMDLDIDVQRLKLLKANHLSQRYALEDQIIKYLPQKIVSLEQRMEGYTADMKRAAENTHPNEDGFSPMEVEGVVYTKKKAAGSAILAACKAMTSPDPVPLGQYRGFAMELSFESFSKEFRITLKGALTHTTSLGTDIFGNILRLDNLLGGMEERLIACREQLENVNVQLANAKQEVEKPFPQEDELKTKSARLDELNILLNMDKRESEIVDGDVGDEAGAPPPSRGSDRWER